MTALPRRRRQEYGRNFGTKRWGASSSSFLVIVLTLIVLFETILLLSLLPRTQPEKDVKKVRSETKKVVSRQLKNVPVRKPLSETLSKIETTIQKPKLEKGEIAIVIDDWGYSKNNLDILEEIDVPLTLAILPFRSFTRNISEFAHEHNYEVIIHMPMEPEDKDGVALEPRTLMTYMGRNAITSIINSAFDNIEYAKGINNHMGSLATKDKRFLAIVFKELKRRNSYFLDSYVVSDSIASDVSKEIGIKFAKRSVFLDNETGPEYIKGQLNQLANEADKKGKAIGIGHDKRNTLLILKQEIPRLTKMGYKFVFLSELVE